MDYFADLIATFLDIDRGNYTIITQWPESSRNESKILICVLKMNEGFMGLEWHEGE